VYNLALRSLGDPREAEDAAQEAFVRAWTALPNFRKQARFRTWLYRIVTNLCYTRLPRLRRDLTALNDEQMTDVPAESFCDPAVDFESTERAPFCFARLTPCRRVIVCWSRCVFSKDYRTKRSPRSRVYP
jgi:RNA polymerase sigma-70 factor (ECF subfamily)